MALRPILNQCLASPSAIALSKVCVCAREYAVFVEEESRPFPQDGGVIYVAEASLNRVLRLLRRGDGAYVSTVFVQLAGGIGKRLLWNFGAVVRVMVTC